MFKKKFLIVLLIIVIFSCSSDSNPAAGINNNDVELNFVGDNQNLDIVTWNIQNFPKHDLTIQYVRQCVNELNVDIIALQEIESGTSLTALQESLGSNWIFFKSSTSPYGNLAYLINTANITINSPYNILSSYSYEFAGRTPYVLELNYNNEDFTLINVHYKCCSDSVNDPDNSDRRRASSIAIYDYIHSNLDNSNVIILGDFNDILGNTNTVLDVFENDINSFTFADQSIADGPSENWSFPTYGAYGSHIDHILITNELTDNVISTMTIKIDDSLFESFADYDYYISDHRPIGISLFISE